MKLRTISGIRSTSVLAIAIAALAAPQAAFAQAAPADDAAAEEEPGITITGFRASLESAVALKKSVDQVVESVSAEDIGKLPDASIAESIARLPGLTSQRLSGRSNSISIRGFSQDFSTTLLNGREQTSTGDNRAVEYDQYPSEVINRVNVYKSPMASLVGQGLSGTVDLRTIRPLDAGRQIFSVAVRGSYADLGKLNAGSREFGYRANALFVGQFADDRIGIALGASYVDEPYQTQEFNAWGYPTDGGNAVIGGSKSYVTSSRLTRLGFNGTLQFKLSDNLTSTFDGFYSDFKDDTIKRGIETPLYWSSATLAPARTASNGFITSGSFSGVKGVVRNDVFERNAELYSFGWNLDYQGDDGWNAMFDASYSATDRNELNIESYSGTGRAGVGATDTLGFTSGLEGTRFTHQLDYSNYNLILLTSPQGWGGTQIATNGTRIDGGQDGYYNDRVIEDRLWQFRTEVGKEMDGFISRFRVGMNYTSRSKSLVPEEYFLGLAAQNLAGTVSIQIPTQYRLGTTDLTYLGLGPMVSYDPRELIAGGVYRLVPNPYGDVVVKAYDIEENLMTGYIQFDYKGSLGSADLTGNFGVQAIWTDQNSNGAAASYLGANGNGSPNIAAVLRRTSSSYVDVLPSFNLSLRFPSDFVIRLALSRQIIRPRLDDMRASTSYGIANGDPGDPARFTCPVGRYCSVVRGDSGNPDLEPWRANAADLTFEKYFGGKGYIALQFFYKDLKSYIYNQDLPFDFTNYPVQNPGLDNGDSNRDGIVDRAPLPIIVNPFGTLKVATNGTGGELYGVELAGTLPFETFIPALSGFGVTGGVSYTKTKISPTPGAPAEDLPGYSRWVANGTVFFEQGGFNIRASMRYRSTFVGEVSGFAANRVRRRAAPETIVDAQIGYDFQEGSALHGLSITLQGQNLTDEPFVTTNPGDPRQVIDFQRYGRRFLLGASYKF